MTPVERTRRFTAIYAKGCIACWIKRKHFSPCQIHHLNLGGKAGQKRRGDEYTIGLCPWHHVGQVALSVSPGQMVAIFGPSLARASKTFRSVFGNDDELLAVQNELIANSESAK